MNPSTPDIRKLTQKELSAAVKAHENADGTASQFTLPESDIHITINACYISGSGQHRAWKYLYYLTINGRKFGGYDRRDSFVAWAIQKIKEVASPESSTAQSDTTGMAITASVDVPEEIKFAGEQAAKDNSVDDAPTASCLSGNSHAEIHLESLADYNDEGETGWNAQGRADIARKMQRIVAGGYNSVDRVIETVEAVTCQN